MTSAVEIIIIIMLCGMCFYFLIWAECSEVCDCCDNIKCYHKDSPDINTETNSKLEISGVIVKSPIQSNFVEI
jgi:hypothetical protein